MIQIKNLRYAPGKKDLYRNLSLALKAGDKLALTGASGVGKTTLLRLVAGLDRPQGGTILLRGKAPRQKGAPTLGMTFQRPALWPHLTAFENASFGLPNWKEEKAKDRVGKLFQNLNITGLEGRKPHEISAGEAQRVALIRAIAPRPEILLLDETFANLDLDSVGAVIDVLNQEGHTPETTLILAAHHESFAAQICPIRLDLTPKTTGLVSPRPWDSEEAN